MRQDPGKPLSIVVIVMPNFNLAATVGFIDPFRAANYLDGCAHFRWEIVSVGGGSVMASNAMAITTTALSEIQDRVPDIAVISSSWTPELHGSPALHSTLKRWSRKGVTLGALDTGAFILGKLRLLTGRRATVHYEHLGAFRELYPDIRVSDQLFVLDGDRITCCGGSASLDFAIQIIRQIRGDTLANSTARYLFHDRLRPHGARQNVYAVEPLGTTVPQPLRKAIEVMESNLESTVSIPDICRRVGISQRQLDRLFQQRVRQTPAAYYRDIRLDRAHGQKVKKTSNSV